MNSLSEIKNIVCPSCCYFLQSPDALRPAGVPTVLAE